MTNSARIVPVILSGGAGTRLWPASRSSRPKQFLPLVDGRTTFEDTLYRISDSHVFAPPMVVTGRDFGFLVADELQRAGLAGRIVLEPMRRDSGAAIAVAAELLRQVDPATLLLVLAADHLVKDKEEFVKTAIAGQKAAADGNIVTFGIKPDKPATGYGYIQPGEFLDKQVRLIQRFVEKPDLEKAALFVDQGYLWNSGNFLFRADVLLGELAAFEPAMHAAAEASARARQIETVGSISIERLHEESFGACPAKSIDYAVMERTSKAAVIPASYGWSDLGSWDALWEVSSKDEAGNVAAGDVTLVGTKDCYVSSEGVHTAVVGLSDVAVIATHDAVLVAPRNVAAELKTVVAELESREATHKLAHRHHVSLHDWGLDRAVIAGEHLTAKLISIKPQRSLAVTGSLDQPLHFVIARGSAKILFGNVETELETGQHIEVGPGLKVDLKNNGQQDLLLLKVNIDRQEPASAKNSTK